MLYNGKPITLIRIFVRARYELSKIRNLMNYDLYVGTWYKPPFQFLNKIKFWQELRINYWTIKAQNYHPFIPFYNSDVREKVLADGKIDSEVQEIYRNGVVVVENYLSSEDLIKFEIFANYIRSSNLERKENDLGYVQSTLPDELKKVVLVGLHKFFIHFFPYKDLNNDLKKLSISYRYDWSKNGIDKTPDVSLWHIDRFVPTLNCIYFPIGANWGAFEKDFGSPVINEFDKKLFSSTTKVNGFDGDGLKRNQLHPNRIQKKFDVKPNTMIVGTHHMLHRRSPINTPGDRFAVFIDSYNYFTRKDLRGK